MSQGNVEIVRGLVDSWNNRDLQAMLAQAHREVEYVNAPTAVEPGTRRGQDELADVLRAQWEALPGGRQEIELIDDRGDEVITVGRVSRLLPESDALIDAPAVISWRFRDGRVIRIEVLGIGPEFQKALEAAGLRE
ncbi:MAG: nuclear transport factor 2 family protein [Solirubrobacterales bacterium]